MHLLPVNLGPLAKLASTGDGRFSMSAVHLRVHDDNTYLAEATDGRYAARVSGPCNDAAEYPEIPALQAAPNGRTEALIASKDWDAACKTAEKATRRVHKSKTELKSLAVVIGETTATLVSTDLATVNLAQPMQVEGRYPDIANVFPAPENHLKTLRVDAKRLAQLLAVAAEYTGDDEYNTVEISLYGNNGTANLPAVVRTVKGEQKFEGLIMPLTAPK